MNNIKLTIAYEGTLFFGWQNNKRDRSVEYELESNLTALLKHPVKLQAASRTDRGVHARNQIVNFFTKRELDLSFFRDQLNAILSEDVRVLSAEIMPDSFHPTLDVLAKEYRYVISTSAVREPIKRNFSWHLPYIVSINAMRESAKKIIGTHDFSGFSNKGIDNEHKESTREIYSIEILELFEELHIVIKGNHFLYKMVRNIVGTLAYIGCGKLELSIIDDIFKNKDRTCAGVTAPAEGLFLEHVYY